MRKLVILTFSDGSFAEGFPVLLRIRDEDALLDAESHISGRLPPSPNMLEFFSKWQQDFHRQVVNQPNHQFSSRTRTT